MIEKFKFTLVNIASFEEFLQLTPEERFEQNDLMVNRLMDLEAFMEKFLRGYNFIHLQHGNTR